MASNTAENSRLSPGLTLVDSHCHLDFPDFADELDAVVGRARAAGIERLVTISTRVRRQASLLAIAEAFSRGLLHGTRWRAAS